MTFDKARSLYPVLVVLVLLAVAVAAALYRSKLVRALLWIKADPAAAAAFGIPVARYRALAYMIAGAFAGFAGGLTAVWVQRLTPQSFPLDRSFAYLIVVVLAGRGFLGGVAAAAAAVEGGRLFLANGDALMTYAAPVGLLLTLTTNKAGLNGVGTKLAALFRDGDRKDATMPTTKVRPLAAAGGVLVALGFAAIALAWYHAGNTDQVWVQNQEILSGGLGGMALIVVGVGLLIRDRVAQERAVVIERWERLIEAIEAQAAATTARRARPLRAAGE